MDSTTRARGTASLAALALALNFSGCKSNTPPDDATLTSAVQGQISSDPAVGSQPIRASVQNGIATLNGTVSDPASRDLASRDAAQVSGLKTIINNLTIQAPNSTAAFAPNPDQPTEQVTTRPEPPVHTIKKSEPRLEPSQMAHNQPPPSPPPSPNIQPAPIVREAPQQPSTPPLPPAPRNIVVPSGTTLPVRITQTLDSATTQQGDTFTGVLASDLFIEGVNVLPQGTRVSGRVTAVQEAAHFKGDSLLTIAVTNLDRNGQQIAVSTDPYTKQGTGRGKNTAEKVGGGAAIGALLGGIFGGGKGAAIGAAAGGGVGAGDQALTRGQQVQIPSETMLRFRTTAPVTVHLNSPSPDPTGDPTLKRHPSN